MGKSKLESALLYLGITFLGLALFREALRLPLWCDWIFPGAAILCFIAVFAVRRRHKKAASAQPSLRKSQSLALRLYSLFVIVIVTLSLDHGGFLTLVFIWTLRLSWSRPL